MDPRFEFRPMTRDDLPLVHRFVNEPHAVPWYGGARSLAEVEEEYLPILDGEVPTSCFIVRHEGKDIGLVEHCRLGDHPDVQEAYGVEDPDTANCDVIIGDPGAVHRGLGAPMIEAFLRAKVFADPRIHTCVIDPFTDNFIAIRAYEKVGFRFLRAVPEDLEGGSVHILELRRDELGVARERARTQPYVRPGRPEELPIAEAIDDDACTAYADVGLAFEGTDEAFAAAERARWEECARAGRLLFACSPEGAPIGFLALGYADGKPYLQQISVRRAWARRGIGRLLLDRARAWSVRPGELWLTTYDASVPWNEPWYTREGFVRVADDACGPELAAILAAERRALPSKAGRIAMVHRSERRDLRSREAADGRS